MEFRLLNKDDIEVKVKQISEKGAVALLYKNARTDMNLLDETAGAMNWKCSYREIKDNLYCEISIYNETTGQWISKEDCGIESREDTEGNQKKGEASDAFKRAGFKWGIGRELYTSPFVFLNVPTKGEGKKWELANRFDKFSVSEISYTDKIITGLCIVNSKGETVYQMGKSTPKPREAVKNDSDAVITTEQKDELKVLMATKYGKEGYPIILADLKANLKIKDLKEIKISQLKTATQFVENWTQHE
jgi:hypothetical protein